jgi:hypothetical protein
MLTAWCLTVAFITPWAVGAPVAWLVRGRRNSRPTDWLWAPFLGLAALVAVLHPLAVFADLPLERTAPVFVAAVGAAWGAMLSSTTGRTSLRRFPVRVAALALAAYLGSGLGVLTEGVEHYRGNMQSDQYQYVALAEFLMDEPFSTGWADLGQRPWLVQPVMLKGDRLGQSVIHGFLAVIAGRPALDLYFPTQLLGPALLVPAVLLLAAQLGIRNRLATCAAVGAALAPGTAILQSLCFLSHALCVPVLVAFLAAVARLARGGSLRPLPCACAAFALGCAVYTEFAPLFLGAAAVTLAAGWRTRAIGPQRIAATAAGLGLAVALSPAAVAGAVSVWERSLGDGGRMTLGSPVPVWAACLWVNSDSAYRFVMANYAIKVRLFVFACISLTAVGAGALLLGALRRNRGVLPAALGATSLLVPPLVLWVLRPGSVYVISKLLWTLTPFLVLFAACAMRAHGAAVRRLGGSARWANVFVGVVLAPSFGLWAYHSVFEQQLYLDPLDLHARSARAWNEPELAELCSELRTHPPTDVVLALGTDAGPPSTELTAMCYHGRQHRIWIASPRRVWWTALDDVPAPQLSNLAAVPPSALVVLPRGAAPASAGAVVFRNERYEIVTSNNLEPGWRERVRRAP